MLQRSGIGYRRRQISPFGPRLTRLTWQAMALAGFTAGWLFGIGSWLDRQENLLRMITWGGHHTIVMGLAVAAVIVLAGLAVPTRGFTEGTPGEATALLVAGICCLVIAWGFIALIAPVAVLAVLTAGTLRLSGVSRR